jgi:hypothetical protein
MQDTYSSEVGSVAGTPPSTQARVTDESWVSPSSSRMLTNYLADVEQNLDEHRWDLAMRDVVDLPKIVVALADSELRSSPERCRAWCEQWVRPPTTENSGMSHEQICRLLDEKSNDVNAQSSTPSGAQASGDSAEASVGSAHAFIPTAQLRRLRLRRHARNAPRGFNASHASKAAHNVAEVFTVCTAVVEGVRRWYAHFACHDAVSQANLARLAVLR